MRVLDDICELLEDELKEITKKGDISPVELDNVYKSVDIIKDIETVKAMKQGGYSNASDGGSYGNSYGNSYDGSYGPYYSYNDGGMSRGDGYSERRGRDAMGRYTSRDGGNSREYSRATETENLKKELEEMRKKISQM